MKNICTWSVREAHDETRQIG